MCVIQALVQSVAWCVERCRVVASCVLLALCCSTAYCADDTPRSIADAVADFNSAGKADAVGKFEPLLTEEEVIAAIHAWSLEKRPAPQDVYDAFQRAADTGTLPAGSELAFTSSWKGHKDRHFDVWWIDLYLKTGPQTGYTYRVRARTLRSRTLTEDEKEELKRSFAP